MALEPRVPWNLGFPEIIRIRELESTPCKPHLFPMGVRYGLKPLNHHSHVYHMCEKLSYENCKKNRDGIVRIVRIVRKIASPNQMGNFPNKTFSSQFENFRIKLRIFKTKLFQLISQILVWKSLIFLVWKIFIFFFFLFGKFLIWLGNALYII